MKQSKKDGSLKQKIGRVIGSKKFTWALLAIFAVQAFVLIGVTKVGIPPDENNHIRFIEFYADNSLSPFFTEQTPTHNLGDKTREVDYLYHYVVSLVVRVFNIPDNALPYVVRTFSVIFALLAFLAMMNVFRRLGLSRAMINVWLLIVTNIVMVLFMSSAVNNDTLVWLGVAGGVLLVLRLLDRPSATDLLILANIALLGGLVKRNLLPACFVFGLFVVAYAVWKRKELIGQVRLKPWLAAGLSLMVILSAGLFAERIVGNVVKYGGITVRCEAIHGDDACSVFWASKREKSLSAQPKKPLMSLPMFALRWWDESIYNILDIQTQSWRHEVAPPRIASMIVVVGSLLVGLAYGLINDIRRWRSPKALRRLGVVALSFGFMTFILLFIWREYLRYQVFGIAINGRYILPGFLLLLGIIVFYWDKLLGRHTWAKWLLATVIIGGLVWFSGLKLLLSNPQLFNG